MRSLPDFPNPHKRGRALSARLTTYRRHRGRFVVAAFTATSLTFICEPGSGPLICVGVRYPWRRFIADLHELADAIEYNPVEGPGDVLALDAPETD